MAALSGGGLPPVPYRRPPGYGAALCRDAPVRQPRPSGCAAAVAVVLPGPASERQPADYPYGVTELAATVADPTLAVEAASHTKTWRS